MPLCALGGNHTVIVSSDGEAFGFGQNDRGQLGLEGGKISVPRRITNLSKIKQVSCGQYFTVCVDEIGDMWSFGFNVCGQLGTGNTQTQTSPQKIEEIPPVHAVSCGGAHTLILTMDENLWSCGYNEHGQLCLGTREAQLKPRQTAYSHISVICAGRYHSLFRDNKGKIYACGHNSFGELGLGHKFHPQIQVCAIPIQFENVIQFCCGFHHTLFLNEDGKVFSVGNNSNGSLGLGHKYNEHTWQQIVNIPPVRTISCVDNSSYLIDFDGNVWSFGANSQGQLGHGHTEDCIVPTKIQSIGNIVQIASGSRGNHFLAKDAQGKIFSMGMNNCGQLGDGTCNNQTTPKEIQLDSNSTIWGDFISTRRAKSARK